MTSVSDTAAAGASPAAAPPSEEERGGFYWTFFHLKRDLGAFFSRHKKKALLVLFVLIACLIIFRPAVHPYIMVIQNHLLLILAWALALGLMLRLVLAHRTFYRRSLRIALAACLLFLMWMWGGAVYQYLSLYLRYQTLTVVALTQWPLTDHERLQPYQSVVNIAQGKLDRNQDEASKPSLVRVNKRYDWTMSVGPKYWYGWDGKLLGHVSGVIDIDATVATPDWSNRAPTRFDTGEQLWLSHDIHTCVVRAFGPLQYFRYEPAEVKYIPDDKGEWVEVVTLIKWGLLGYQPLFGGVMVIRQIEAPMFGLNWLKLVAFGCGEWIPPEEVKKHPFLVGQNLVPEAVTRYMAESFSFRAGFIGPLTHDQDVRIPKLPDDYNEMPYIAFFKGIPNEQDKLHHNYLLEPQDLGKNGLSLTLFIPGDLGEPVYSYHEAGLTGPAASSITASIRDSNQAINWVTSHPVERRLWIRECNGKPRPFYLTNIVSQAEGGKGTASDAGNHITLTGMGKDIHTIWVDSKHPESWLAHVQKEFPDECAAKP